MSTMTDTRPATAQQFEDIRTVIASLRAIGADTEADIIARTGNHLREQGLFDFAQASGLVDRAVRMRTEVLAARSEYTAAVAKKVQRDLPQVPEGGYAVDNEGGELRFYEVEVDKKTGYVDVFVRHSDERTKLPFSAVLSVLNKIVAKGLLEASKDFGREMGICGKCGRSLTDAASRAAGIGPVCAGKLGA